MSFEEQLLNKINQFRTNPKGYAKKINEYIHYFKDNTLIIPGKKTGIKTEEGAAAYIEAVDFLAKQEDVKPLKPSKGLGRICVDFMEKATSVDPEEIGNIDLEEIINKYGSFSGSLNRAIDFGGEDPEQVLINLIVCDGDPERGNRDSLLSADLKKIGIKNSIHSTYRFCTLIISCSKFKNNIDSDDNGFFGISKTINNNKIKITKPKEDVYKKKPKEEQSKNDKEEEDIPPDGFVSENKTEKIVVEKGIKKKVTKIIRTKADGSKVTETIKEILEDD